jgi:hypothetical protein
LTRSNQRTAQVSVPEEVVVCGVVVENNYEEV